MAVRRLEIVNLACARGEKTLFRGLHVTLAAGTLTRVLGDNGSGKTTLLRTIAGLHAPLKGRIVWRAPPNAEGEPPALRDDLCFVGHDNALNGALTAIENLQLLLCLAGQASPATTIEDVLDTLGLAAVAHRACRRLSAGQRRRVSLARLWLTRAPLWLLDEPASALDVHAREALGRRIAAHAGNGGIVLYTTHEALPLGDCVPNAVKLPAC